MDISQSIPQSITSIKKQNEELLKLSKEEQFKQSSMIFPAIQDDPPYSYIFDNLFTCSEEFILRNRTTINENIKLVVNCCAEPIIINANLDKCPIINLNIQDLNLSLWKQNNLTSSLKDFATFRTEQNDLFFQRLQLALPEIDKYIKQFELSNQENEATPYKVMIVSKRGTDRCFVVAIAYLVRYRNYTLPDAFTFVKTKQENIFVGGNQYHTTLIKITHR
jgi:hypothetical protein